MIGNVWRALIAAAPVKIWAQIGAAMAGTLVLLGFGLEFPAFLATDYRSTLLAAKAAAAGGVSALSPEQAVAYQAHLHHPELFGVPIVFNLLAALITAAITILLVRGIKESARVNDFIVVLKVATLTVQFALTALW